MSDTYSADLQPYLEPIVPPSAPGEPTRFTVRPMPPLGAPSPVVPKQPKPVTLTPVEHQPDFSIQLHPVEHQPEFVDQQPTQLTDEQLRQISSQKDQIAPAPYHTPGGVGESAVQNYRDYFDPFATNEHGRVADQPMTPNAQGKVEPVLKEPMLNAALAGADIATLMPLPGGGAVKAIFAGAAARGANLVKLAHAAELEKAGQHPPTIRQITDWFRGADGIWRFEVPDINAHFSIPRNDARANEVVKLLNALPVNDPRVPALIEERNKLNTPSAQVKKLGDVLDHEALYAQYPHLRDMPLAIKDDLGGARGMQIRGRKADPNLPWGDLAASPGRMELDAKTGANRLTALHEAQHEIQDVEGFARGGSYSTPEVSAVAEAQVGVRRRELLEEAKKIDAKKMAWMKEKYGYDGTRLDAADGYWEQHRKYTEMADAFWSSHPEESSRLMEISAATHQLNAAHQRALHDAYRRLAGEVESRNVEARTGMTPTELARKEPLSTEDVPRDKQIVIGPQENSRSMSVDGDDERTNKAAKAGFSVKAFHGTSSDFDNFNRIDGGNARGRGFYFSQSPETASRYSTGDVNRISPDGNAYPNVMPVMLKMESPFVERDLVPIEKLRAIEKALIKSGQDWKKGEFLKRFDRVHPPNGSNVAQEISYNADQQNEILRAVGYDSRVGGPMYGDAKEADYVVFRPEQIRSINARFDPAKKSSGNILAGVGAGAIGAGAAANSYTDKLEPYVQ